MNTSLALPQPANPSVASAVLSRLRSLVSAATDRAALGRTDARPYSFQSECECPDDCLRDHENE